MSDVRALLKAKREEQRISHPYAAYTSSGQLRCSACGVPVKHASAWNGHVGSKIHRTNVARLKEEERVKAEEEQRKRKAEEMEDDVDLVNPKRQKVSEEDENEDEDKRKATNANGSEKGFPADFFSDPSRTLPTLGLDSDEEIENEAPEPIAKAAPSASQQQPPTELDLEWAKFQETVIDTQADEDEREKYAYATVSAEPELINEVPEGFPPSVIQENTQTAPEAPKDEAEERKRKEEEERELIMDRLLDEERAQEEADERVTALKARLELIKRRRMLAKSKKETKDK